MIGFRAFAPRLIVAFLVFAPAGYAVAESVPVHHFAPLLDEVMRVNDDSDSTFCPEEGTATPENDEDWRRGAVVPPLLVSYSAEEKKKDPAKKDLLSYREVCEAGRARNKELAKAGEKPRKFALVLAKMHICDYMTQACIHAARTFFDPCNKFISENFIPFHARTYFDGGAKPEGGKEMAELYENPSGPRLTPIDLETCQPVTRNVTESGKTYAQVGIEANRDHVVDGEQAWKSDRREVRFAEMRDRIAELMSATPSAKAKIDAKEWNKPAEDLVCPENEKIPVLKYPEAVPQIRTLMNEQYKTLTGKDAAAKVRWPKK